MAKEKLSDIDLEQKAISIIAHEKGAWEDATAFVTDRVSFQMRNLIRRLRKNYWGIFEDPNDPVTNTPKVWVPLTESMVEATVKNIDLDTKDINFRAKRPESIGLTAVLRSFVKAELDKIDFGEILDKFERTLAIDGTAVWKTMWKKKNGKKVLDIRPVDLLNIYIDPLATSVQDDTIIERAVISHAEFMEMTEWVNKEEVVGSSDIHPTDEDMTTTTGTTEDGDKWVEVFERWGTMPLSLITGLKKDEKEMVEGRIVASGNHGRWVFHFAEKTKGWKPYEEAWFTRVDGRWYGKGQAEKLNMLQMWLNTTVNIRINRHRVSQLGIFKIKQNRGITPQMVARLAANGAIKVKDMGDIEQMPIQDASPSSYKDEEVIQTWAERSTQTFEAATGETLPASTTATGAAIQSRSAQTSFILIKEQMGMFLQRWIKRHVLPELMKTLSQGDVLTVSGEKEDVRAIDERVINEMLYKEVRKMNKKGFLVSAAEIERERAKLQEKFQRMGNDRYVKILKKIDPSEFDTQVFVTNEEFDKGVMSQNLTSILQVAPEFKDVILKQIFDLMGLDSNSLQAQPQLPPEVLQAGQQQAPQGLTDLLAQSTQGAVQQAPQVV